MPAEIDRIVNSPSSLVRAWLSPFCAIMPIRPLWPDRPLSSLPSVTRIPSTGAPDESSTTPEIELVGSSTSNA